MTCAMEVLPVPAGPEEDDRGERIVGNGAP